MTHPAHKIVPDSLALPLMSRAFLSAEDYLEVGSPHMDALVDHRPPTPDAKHCGPSVVISIHVSVS